MKGHRYEIIWNCCITEDALGMRRGGINQFRDARDDGYCRTCESRFLYDAVSCAPPCVNDGRKNGRVRRPTYLGKEFVPRNTL